MIPGGQKGGGMDPGEVTLYIPCFNAAHFLEEVLPAVKRLNARPAELLIVDDDGTTDNTIEVVDRHAQGSPFPIRRVSAGMKTGLAHARNVALEHTTTPFIASLDADCVPEPDWLSCLLGGMSDGVSGVGGRLEEGYREQAPDLWRAVHAGQTWGDELTTDPQFLFGHGNLFMADALRSVGGYDATLKRAGEDYNMSVRLKAAGHTLVYDPAARCRHLRRDTFRSILDASFTYSQWSARKGLKNFIGRAYGHALRSAALVLSDLAGLRFRLLPISAAYFPWMVYREIMLRRQAGWESGYQG
jgi:glycosyltransferase involved in cell wall biosynthesis